MGRAIREILQFKKKYKQTKNLHMSETTGNDSVIKQSYFLHFTGQPRELKQLDILWL